jgi:predicted AlkP superfamily pyrophosphatase or phosphodiesterase
MKRVTEHLVVISFDCLSSLDFPIIQDLPGFQELLEHGSFCQNVETVYPSVTYPCHATIVTGKYPKHHGIVNNTLLQPGRASPDWYWHRHYIQGTTLFDEAKKAGMKTAALLWPVTAGANIDYNMPEIFANRPWHHQILVSLFNGSPFFQLDANRRFGHIRKGLNQPELDDFVLEAAVHTIKTKKPNLVLIHFTDLDTQRHYHGFSSKEAIEAILRHDIRLKRIIGALKEEGIYKNSTVIALGDHSALDVSKAINLNALFLEHGLINTNRRGKITQWKAYCKSCDGSAYIYLKDVGDFSTKKTVQNLLEHLLKDKSNGIEKVLTGYEAADKGADPRSSFMIEALQGFYFKEDHLGNFIVPISPEDVKTKRYTIAAHGYSPKKENYKTLLIACGKGIRKNATVPSMRLIDEGPTFARLLGLTLGKTDGKIIEELIASD